MNGEKSNLTETKIEKINEIQNLSKTPKFNMNIIKNSSDSPKLQYNFKQIYEIYDTGKREIIEHKGKIQECDIFGFPSKKYYNGISGYSNYNFRLNKKLIEEVKFNNKSLYIPIISKFEGASMFPRPLSIPFANKKLNQLKLVKEIKKEERITEKKNKVILSLNKPLKDNESIPNFICQKMAQKDTQSLKYLINLINKYINTKKEEHKYESDFEEKSKEIKNLKKYQKKLYENLGNELYNGKKVFESKQKDIKEKYETIRKLIYYNGIKDQNRKENSFININKFKKFNSLKRNGTMTHLFKHKIILSKNKSCTNIFGKSRFKFRNKENDFISSNEENINSSMNETNSLFSKHNINKEQTNYVKASDNLLSSLTNKNIQFKTKSCNLNNDYRKGINLKYNFDLYTPNRINASQNKNKTSIVFFQNPNNSTKDKILKNDKNNSKDSLSFISCKEKNKINFRTKNDLTNIYDKEKKLLKGFQAPSEDNDKIILKYSNFENKQQAFDNYINDVKLFEMVNKFYLEKEKKQNLLKENMLKRKIEEKRLFEKNFGKIHFK